MIATIRTIAMALVFVILGALPAWAEPILPAPEKVSDHVYAWIGPLEGPNKDNRGYRMNLVFVVGADAVAVLDTGYTRDMGEEMIAHIRAITDRPIRYAVNTNSQSHRHFGNDAFHAIGAAVIATPEEAERMNSMGGMFAEFGAQALGLADGQVKAPAAPSKLIDAPTVLDLGGGVTVSLSPAGGNHTPNSLIVDIPSDKVVYTGDVLYGERLLAVLDVSNVPNWIAAFDRLRAYDGYTFIPGHGHPGPLSDFEFPTYGYLKGMFDFMMAAIEAGKDIDTAVKSYDQSAYEALVNFEQLAGRNASWTYQQAEFASF